MTMRVLIGQPRFSADQGWQDLLPHFPPHLDVVVEAVDSGGLESGILDGLRPDVVVPFMSAVTETAIRLGGFGLVQQFGAGTDTIDISAATRAGVWVANM